MSVIPLVERHRDRLAAQGVTWRLPARTRERDHGDRLAYHWIRRARDRGLAIPHDAPDRVRTSLNEAFAYASDHLLYDPVTYCAFIEESVAAVFEPVTVAP